MNSILVIFLCMFHGESVRLELLSGAATEFGQVRFMLDCISESLTDASCTILKTLGIVTGLPANMFSVRVTQHVFTDYCSVITYDYCIHAGLFDNCKLSAGKP